MIMQMLRSFITPFIALAVFAAPMMCCCTGVMGQIKNAEAQTAAVPDSPCGHCPSESDSSTPSNQENTPVPGHSDDCECDKTVVASSFTAELKLSPAVEIPVFILPAVVRTESLYQGDFLKTSAVAGQPPSLALRERLSLLCVFRI